MRKNRFFWFDGQFKVSWLKSKGFWRILWRAFWYEKYISWDDKEGYSIGIKEPLQLLWDWGYNVGLCGWVLGKPILYYYNTGKHKWPGVN
jgi:hypothetical protein